MNLEVYRANRHRWPRPLILREIDAIEADERGLDLGTPYYHRSIFSFLSDVWGEIVLPEGSITDLASIPLVVGLIDPELQRSSHIMRKASQPHDKAFEPVIVGGHVTRGWLDPLSVPNPRRLTLRQTNELLIEGMRYSGASEDRCARVMWAVETFNRDIAHEFAPA